MGCMDNAATPHAPLAGLRVLEVATGVAGPYAGRLLAMLGATVVKVEPAEGDPARTIPVDGGPQVSPSPLFVHLNAGKRSVGAESITPEEGLAWADVVLSDRVARDFGPWEDTGSVADPPMLVSVTAWGTGHDDPGSPSDELLVQAASGLLAATEQDGQLWRFPGWQSQYLAGAYAAAAALAGLGRHGRAEVTWVGAARSAVECQAAATLYGVTAPHGDEREEEVRQAGFQTNTFPSGAFACADGYVVPGTVRGKDWTTQCELYGRPDLVLDPRFSWRDRWRNREQLRAEIADWYLARTRREIFDLALKSGWSAGMVLSAQDVLTDPHLRERGFVGTVSGAARGPIPVRPWRVENTTAPTVVRLARRGEDDGWFQPRRPRSRPLWPVRNGLRVVELTWAWAGPFVGRFLASTGADVIRVEAGAHPDGWRTRFRLRDLGTAPGEQHAPTDVTYDASAQFNSLNRGKRAVSVDLSRPDGARVFRELVAAADVLVVNMNHRVLADRGLDGFVREQVERGLVHITMPALGAVGPDRAMPGFGMLTEAMGGFAARFGSPGEGARTSPTYYPDAVSGVHATVAVLAALAARAAGGPGAAIDFSQQEALWLQFGEGVVLAGQQGRSPARLGNAEPGAADAGVLSAADGHLAYVVATEQQARAVRELLERDGGTGGTALSEALTAWAAHRDTDAVREALRAAGARCVAVQHIRSLFHSGTLAAQRMLELVDHPVAGKRAYLGIPVALDGEPLRADGPAPMFDQHTDEVLTEWLDYSPERLAALRGDAAIGTVPKGSRPRARS
ncbi:putative acyl-CoA transferase/carnitine dehydratase [Saccharomonospora cyanea NA-134]|uniref:Putative acyl-CoA transferase/carnitine dehydratase n=2 Tax=Saccharomonospora cyanea TaxID=40989 RepID=H5XHM1_9PSEU|nr:putative acyl-CoA transferase/carnitine dehydratase [Saccharomonospora cyanea NA-134]